MSPGRCAAFTALPFWTNGHTSVTAGPFGDCFTSSPLTSFDRPFSSTLKLKAEPQSGYFDRLLFARLSANRLIDPNRLAEHFRMIKPARISIDTRDVVEETTKATSLLSGLQIVSDERFCSMDDWICS